MDTINLNDEMHKKASIAWPILLGRINELLKKEVELGSMTAEFCSAEATSIMMVSAAKGGRPDLEVPQQIAQIAGMQLAKKMEIICHKLIAYMDVENVSDLMQVTIFLSLAKNALMRVEKKDPELINNLVTDARNRYSEAYHEEIEY
jgi:hypothetical protein